MPTSTHRPSAALARAAGTAFGPYQTAVVRIGFAFTWLAFLLREWPHRQELYGPDGPWSWGLARRLIDDNHAFTALMWSDGQPWFEAVYALAVAASALLLVGWHTRAMSVLFMLGVLSLQNRSVFMGDGGDNIVHLIAMYLVLTRCGRVWSLDARRAHRTHRARLAPRGAGRVTGPVLWAVCGLGLAGGTLTGELGPVWLAFLWGLWLTHAVWWAVAGRAHGSPAHAVLDALANLTHNAALLVIMGQVCLVYATAGWYKIQGGRWQDGTALHYPLHLDYFSPWPALSGLLGGSGMMVLLLTYGTVAVQVAFPFTLFNRRVKNVLLAAMMAEHAAIAVVLGLPFFSLAMIAADAVFLPSSLLRRFDGRAARRTRRRAEAAAPGPVLADTPADTTPQAPDTPSRAATPAPPSQSLTGG
ncbi:HTTM domain-containing protein [Streptomyces sp. NPDC054796]